MPEYLPNQANVEKFIDLLQKSGLPEERQMYWLDVLKRDAFDEDTNQQFISELEAHISDLDTAVKDTEEDLEAARAQFRNAEESAVPHLQNLVDKQTGMQESERANREQDISKAEAKMMGQIEEMRASEESAEIEVLRKKLKG